MKYSLRLVFPKNCVTFNPGSESEFTNSIIDFYSDSLESLKQIDPSNHERINMDGIYSYDQILSQWDFNTEMWVTLSETSAQLNETKQWNQR